MSILILFIIIFLINVQISLSVPIGPTVTNIRNSTRVTLTNTTINDSLGGGYIYTYNFDAIEQNKRWKAYVGNITGTLTLDDASGYSVYDWAISTTNARIYATKNSSTVNWTNINCTWGFNGNYSNKTIINREDASMQHTRLDNITATFNQRNHSSFMVGDRLISQDSCYSVFTFVNNSRQTSTTYFEEVLLFDGSSETNGKVIYAALAESDARGYNGNDPAQNSTYDFQMILPEVGTDSWTSSTAYYFYVELI